MLTLTRRPVHEACIRLPLPAVLQSSYQLLTQDLDTRGITSDLQELLRGLPTELLGPPGSAERGAWLLDLSAA